MKELELSQEINRRHFLRMAGGTLGGVALGAMAGASPAHALLAPHAAPKAKRIIYMFQSGAPSQRILVLRILIPACYTALSGQRC